MLRANKVQGRKLYGAPHIHQLICLYQSGLFWGKGGREDGTSFGPFHFHWGFFCFLFFVSPYIFWALVEVWVDWKRQGRSVAWYELTATLQGSSNKSYELDETCMLTPSWTYRGKILLCTSRTMETFYCCLARCLSLIKIASTPFTGIEL